MKRKIIGLFVILAVLVAATTTGCKKEDPVKFTSANNINAKVVNDDDGQDVSKLIDSVYAVVYGGGMEMVISPTMDKSKAPSRAIIYGNPFIAGRAKYANGGFSMQLSDVPSKYLTSVTNLISHKSITISNKDASYAQANFIGVKKGLPSGGFSLYNLKASGKRQAIYMYVDADVNISGTIKEEDEEDEEKYYYSTIFDMKLKKGWNIVLKTHFWGVEEYIVKYISTTNLNDYLWYYRMSL